MDEVLFITRRNFCAGAFVVVVRNFSHHKVVCFDIMARVRCGVSAKEKRSSNVAASMLVSGIWTLNWENKEWRTVSHFKPK